jgi:hypothetical protein
VQQVIAETLGSALLTSLDARFDDLLATNSLRIFDATEIPAIRSAIPPQVTAVKFQSDLTEASAVHAAELARASDLWRSLLPTQPGPSR